MFIVFQNSVYFFATARNTHHFSTPGRGDFLVLLVGILLRDAPSDPLAAPWQQDVGLPREALFSAGPFCL